MNKNRQIFKGNRCNIKEKKKFEGLRQLSIATTIPFVFLAGPVVGYFAGIWLDKWLGTAPYLMIIMVLLGFVASARESYLMIKQIAREQKDSDDEEF